MSPFRILEVLLFCIIGTSVNAQLNAQRTFDKSPFIRTQRPGRPSLTNDPTKPWRLPLSIKPSRYDVQLSPIIDEDVPDLGAQWTAPGDVKITFSVVTPTPKIVIHAAKNLLIPGSTSVMKGDSPVAFSNETYEEDTQFHTINFSSNLTIGEDYTLEMQFIAPIIETELNGMYRSSYLDPLTNETKWIAVTQMEALHARQVFPCFDEPSFKAVFRMTIGRKSSNVALANSISLGSEPMAGVPGWLWESFDDTVQMSTYLLAIVISQFQFSQAPDDILDIPFRTYAPQHDIELGGGVYPSEMGAIILKNYTSYFEQPYPMPKMDLVAVPDFWFGAMENFGLNIYRDGYLLYFEGETTEDRRMLITDVISHELGHQYFGNLVSPAFWTHIWLNEGFATFIEFIGLEHVAPEFNPWDFFISDDFQRALVHDSVPAQTHSLKIDEQEWITKWAMDWFDLITYQKGACMVRMMQGFLSKQVFQEGLRAYQAMMKFQAAEQDDLFAAIATQVPPNLLPEGITFAEVMHTWTLQPGYPFLYVTEDQSSPNIVQISQRKFADDGSSAEWIVPVSIASESNPDFDAVAEYWLTNRSAAISESSDAWLVINAGTTGFYRVMYSEKLEGLIQNQLVNDPHVIHHHNRGQFIDDYLNFAWDRTQNNMVERALSFTKYMGTAPETEHIVWNSLLAQMSKFLNFGSVNMINSMKGYLLPRIKLAINATGGIALIDKTSRGMDVIRHTQLLDWACALEDPECHSYSLELMRNWDISNITNNPVQLDLQPVVYCSAAKDVTEYASMTLRYRMTEGSSQNPIILRSLSCTQDNTMIDLMLKNVLDSSFFLDGSHALTFMTGLASNPNARKQLFDFVRTNTAELIEEFGDSGPIVSVISALSSFISSVEEYNEIEQFVSENESILPDMSGYMTKMQNNINLMLDFGLPIQQFFLANSF